MLVGYASFRDVSGGGDNDDDEKDNITNKY